MEIAIHLGGHRTDDDLILRTLQRNGKRLQAAGIAVPPAGRARPAIRRAAQSARGAALSLEAQDALLSEILGGEGRPRRMLLSYEAFLGVYAKVLGGDRMYADAGQRATLLQGLFPEHRVSFFLGMRNPATLIPALYEASTVESFAAFVEGQDLQAMRWSDPVRAIRAACPDSPLTVWCNEDLPLVWPDVLETISGLGAALDGEDAVLERVMTAQGIERLRAYLKDKPPLPRPMWRKVATAFLGKFADPDVTEPAIDQPGWTEGIIATLTAVYEDDMGRIADMPGVVFLRP